MDYSKFNDDEFDAKEWINSAFKAHKEGSLEQYATTLVMKLQMFMQEVNNVIEDGCQQAVTNLPRVSKELEAVKQEATLLQEQMKMAKYDIQKVEHDTANSMQSLLLLDQIKSRMKLASDALREADNWTTLSSDVDEVFDSQDLEAIASKIIGMQQSLHILTDVPDYIDRCQYLELLKNRLEAMSSALVVNAFTNLSLDEAQKFARIFSDIERLPQLFKYYHKCQKAKLLELWKDIHNNDDDDDDDDDGSNGGGRDDDDDDDVTSGDVLRKKLNKFYDKLLLYLQAQFKWCDLVFPQESTTIVCDLFSDAFKSLDPPLNKLIDRCLQSSSGTSSSLPSDVDVLINIKLATDNFVAFLQQLFTTQQLESCKLNSLETLLFSIYLPYHPSIHQFCAYERKYLNEYLDGVRLDHSDFLESTSLLDQSISKIFNAAIQSNERCMKLTKGVVYVSYVDVIKEYLLTYAKELKRVITNIFEKSRGNSLLMEEWSHFQNSLRVIQLCGDLILHLDELDLNMTSNIVAINSNNSQQHLQQQQHQQRKPHVSTSKKCIESELVELKRCAFTDYKLFLLDSNDERKRLNQLIDHLEMNDSNGVLDSVKKEAYDLCELVHKLSFDIVFNPLQHHFKSLPQLQVWTSDTVGSALTHNLPNFSYTPQEYITNERIPCKNLCPKHMSCTQMCLASVSCVLNGEPRTACRYCLQVGQYLMTLPQQLEPFTSESSVTMKVAVKHGKLPYTEQIEPSEHLADLWLESLARGCMHVYCQQILLIHLLTPTSTKQLLADIDYITNVLEDLGLQISEMLLNIKNLLQASPQEFQHVAENCSQRLSSTVANMRGLDVANNL